MDFSFITHLTQFELIQFIQGNSTRKCTPCGESVAAERHPWGAYGYFAAFPRGSHLSGESLAKMQIFGWGCPPPPNRRP